MYSMRRERFLVEATLLDYTDGDSLDISSSVMSINVKRDYISNSFPLFVVNLRLTEELRSKIRDNEVTLDLKVDKYQDLDDEQTEETETPVITGRVMDIVIKPYKKPFSTANIREEDDEDTSLQTNTISLIDYQFSGIPEQLILKNIEVVNEIYENAKISDILINIISKTETGKIFIDTVDNKEREDSLLIPPMNIIPAIKFLQEYYGIYNSKMGLFFDLTGTYIFKHFNKSRSYTNTFEIIVPEAIDIDDDIIFTSIQIDEDDINARLYLKNSPNIDSSTEISMDTIGQTAVFSSYDENFETVKRIYSNDTSNEKTRYFWNSNQNKVLEESILNTVRISQFTSIPLANIDPNYFNIDTLYTFSTPQESVVGIYMLIESDFSFSTTDKLHYTGITNLTLAKVE